MQNRFLARSHTLGPHKSHVITISSFKKLEKSLNFCSFEDAILLRRVQVMEAAFMSIPVSIKGTVCIYNYIYRNA